MTDSKHDLGSEDSGEVVTVDDLRKGIRELDRLSRDDYGRSIEDLYNLPDREAASKLGRLIGVSLKEPFATPVQRATPSELTGSRRDWELDVEALGSAGLANTWQHRTLVALSTELGYSGVVSFAQDAHHERGFFQLFAVSLRKYICEDPKVRKRVRNDLAAARAAGVHVGAVDPEILVASGGATLASYLIIHIPLLGLVGAPAIVGIILLLYRVGIDAFCELSTSSHVRE